MTPEQLDAIKNSLLFVLRDYLNRCQDIYPLRSELEALIQTLETL